MKKEIHPEYFENTTIKCACGATYTTGSTKEAISVELCSNCHPFFTGTQNIVDTARRVERFESRVAKSQDTAGTSKRAKRAKRRQKQQDSGPTVEVEETATGRVVKKSIRVTKTSEAKDKEA